MVSAIVALIAAILMFTVGPGIIWLAIIVIAAVTGIRFELRRRRER
ncbi:MAG TPA: hypothetical protein VGE95_16220 [Arthrobacter sp.]